MAITLRDAASALAERKTALGVEGAQVTLSDQDAKLLISGFDIDAEELASVDNEVVNFLIGAMINMGIPPLPHWIAGQWNDGLLTGMMYMKLKYEEESRYGNHED